MKHRDRALGTVVLLACGMASALLISSCSAKADRPAAGSSAESVPPAAEPMAPQGPSQPQPIKLPEVKGGILAIGDSHCTMSFGHALEESLRASNRDRKISFYGVSSASTHYYFTGESSHGGYYFHPEDERPRMDGGGVTPAYDKDGVHHEAVVHEANTPKLSVLLKRHPAFTIVALGSNQFGWGVKPLESEIAQTIRMIHEARSKCIWIGPPRSHPDPRPHHASGFKDDDVMSLYVVLDRVAKKEGCELIDSRPCATYPEGLGDGMHFDALTFPNGKRDPAGVKMGREWGQKVGADAQAIIEGYTGPQTHCVAAP